MIVLLAAYYQIGDSVGILRPAQAVIMEQMQIWIDPVIGSHTLMPETGIRVTR